MSENIFLNSEINIQHMLHITGSDEGNDQNTIPFGGHKKEKKKQIKYKQRKKQIKLFIDLENVYFRANK